MYVHPAQRGSILKTTPFNRIVSLIGFDYLLMVLMLIMLFKRFMTALIGSVLLKCSHSPRIGLTRAARW